MANHFGKFVWFELYTKDAEAAKRFYGELFGWKINEVEMNGTPYSMIMNGEAGIGGLTKLEGPHPYWATILSVENVDEVTAKVKKAGGKVMQEPFDFPGVGRLAMLSDPQGGAFFVIRGENDAEDKDTKHGDWYWNELLAQDAEKAAKFYEQCFGFGLEPMSMGPMKYFVLKAEGKSRAGIMNSPMPEAPTSWLPYVRVDDVDGLVKRTKKLGGQVMSEPQDIPNIGRFAVLSDPEGAAIAVITPPKG